MTMTTTTRRADGPFRLALALFGLGALPAFVLAQDRGVALLGAGIAYGLACTLAIDVARCGWSRLGPKAERRWTLLAPILRIALGFGGLCYLGFARPWSLRLDELEALVLVVGLTYPAFLVRTSIRLADDAQVWARQEARLA